MKYKENIEQVGELLPDYMGFIFYDQSKRYVTEEFELPLIPSEIKKIGVFVNADADYIIEKINKYNLEGIQLHGEEPPYFCRQMKRITTIIKAFGIDEQFDFKTLEAYKDSCNFFLFDTKTAQHGGSGQQFSWSLLQKYSYAVPFFISGGIDLELMKKMDELAALYPSFYGVDVNSKFEDSPALKDIGKLKILMDLYKEHS